MLDDGKAYLTREVEIFSRKDIKFEDIKAQQIHMLGPMRVDLWTDHPPGSESRQS